MNEPPRLIKNNIQTFSHRRVYQVRNALPIDATSKHLTKALHTAAAKEALNSYEVNHVLQRHPPAIAKEEQTLDRKTRCRLSQLRSGWCSILNSYQNKINPLHTARCPECNAANHDVSHLFACPRKSVQLDVVSLWQSPVEATTVLQLQ